MEKHNNQTFLNKISYLSITIATFTLILTLLFHSPCPHPTPTHPHPTPTHHPKSSCAAAHRRITTLHHKNHRLWSTATWRKSVKSFTTLFHHLHPHLTNHTRTLIVSAGGGQPVMALTQMGLRDVTGVEVVGSPPLVGRGDPHRLPFLDGGFGFGFSGFLDSALFPERYVGEMERCVGVGGVVAVCVEECGEEGVVEVLKMFRRSEFVWARNVTLMGSKMTMIVNIRVGSGS